MQIRKYHKRIALALAAGGLFLSVAPAAVSAQSLWAEGGRYRNIFSDRKAQEVGDILTIAISESTTLSTSKASSNSKKLYEICKANCAQTYFIQELSDIVGRLPKVSGLVGITAGASTPKYIIEEVQSYVRNDV